MLDVCCYTGGFGLYALAKGEAAEVTCVDLDEKAIAVARENANANQVRPNFVHSDAFGYMRQMGVNGKTFGVVVLDPPKLIPGRLDISAGKRKYFDLNVLALNCVEPGGMLADLLLLGTAPGRGVRDPAEGRRPQGRPVGAGSQPSQGAAPDHPVGLEALEGSYLKAVWLRVGRPDLHALRRRRPDLRPAAGRRRRIGTKTCRVRSGLSGSESHRGRAEPIRRRVSLPPEARPYIILRRFR